METAIGGPNGVQGTRAPPAVGPISFVVMQFSEENWPNNGLASMDLGLASSWEILDPPLATEITIIASVPW